MALTQATPATTAATIPTTASGGVDINAIVGGWVDRGPWTYYDTFYWPLTSPTAALPPEIDFFAVAMNQLDTYVNIRKTKLQTNMVRAGEFAPPRCLVLMNIGLELFSWDKKADIDPFMNSCWLEMKIDEKIFWEGPPTFFPPGVGIFGNPNPTGTDQNWSFGLPAPQYTFRTPEFPKYIAPLQNFSVKLFFQGAVSQTSSTIFTSGTPPTLTSGFALRCNLNGLTDRSVQ